MRISTPVRFCAQALPGARGTLYTVPTAKKIIVRQVSVANQSTVNVAQWNLWLANVNIVIAGAGWQAPAGKNIDYELWQILEAGELIEGQITAGSANIFISGMLRDA